MQKKKKIKSEVELVEEMLKKEGFTRITWLERRSPEFRESLKEFDLRKKKIKERTGRQPS